MAGFAFPTDNLRNRVMGMPAAPALPITAANANLPPGGAMPARTGWGDASMPGAGPMPMPMQGPQNVIAQRAGMLPPGGMMPPMGTPPQMPMQPGPAQPMPPPMPPQAQGVPQAGMPPGAQDFMRQRMLGKNVY